jgi:hypothetical protein
MRVARWELALSMVGLAFASVFVFSNVWGLGIALLCADVVWLLSRVKIVEKHAGPGRYGALRGRLGMVRVAFVFVIYIAVFYGLYIVHHDVKSNSRVAVVANFALAGFALLLLGELKRGGDEASNRLVGARAERKVGVPLNAFRDRGWLVLHGYKKDRGGDIDHVLCGPNGTYVVETKSYGFLWRDVRQTRGNAWWLREKLGVPWVTGVLCVDEDRPPEQRDKVWVVNHSDLVSWLEAQRNQPVDPERARATLLA